ncbi:MAG: APC family permease [Cyanobacteria bacterium K_Offshore_surface_m2_239]|nr:APC family permease [Cyanobacteria bacterium K_Offshore_surface_m2_239]
MNGPGESPRGTGAEGPPPSGQLLSILGVGFGVAGAIGATIGAGILRTPGLVAAQLPSAPWLLGAWILGGLLALLGACCVAELSASFPRAGGWCVFAGEAFGPRVGGLVGWADWLAHCIGLAWEATTVGEIAGDLLPDPFGLPHLTPRLLALASLAIFLALQLVGLRVASASQDLLSLVKAVVFLALVAACFLLPLPAAAGGAAVAAPSLGSTPWPGATLPWRDLVGSCALALQAVITTYDGWVSPVYFAEEFSDPARDLPRSLIGGVLLVLALYLLINAALLHVLPLEDLARSPLPAAEAALRLLGPPGGRLITAVALVALLGLINSVLMAAARILYGLSREGLLPPWVAAVNAGGTPSAAVLLTAGMAALLVVAGSFERLLSLGALLYVALPLTGVAALVRLRRQRPEAPRPFRVWAYPLPPLLVALVSLAFLAGELLTHPWDGLLAGGLVGIGVPIFWRASRPAPASAPP